MSAVKTGLCKRKIVLRRFLFVFVVMGITLILGYGIIQERLASSDLYALIRGRDDVKLTRLEINKQQRRVVCTDKVVLAYLASSLRNSQADWLSGGGIFYEFSFGFSTGRQYQVNGYIHLNQWSLVVPNANPKEGHGVTHAASLPAQIPDRVREMFEFLNARYQDVSGKVLILEPDQPIRYDYVASLDLEGRGR